MVCAPAISSPRSSEGIRSETKQNIKNRSRFPKFMAFRVDLPSGKRETTSMRSMKVDPLRKDAT